MGIGTIAFGAMSALRTGIAVRNFLDKSRGGRPTVARIVPNKTTQLLNRLGVTGEARERVLNPTKFVPFNPPGSRGVIPLGEGRTTRAVIGTPGRGALPIGSAARRASMGITEAEHESLRIRQIQGISRGIGAGGSRRTRPLNIPQQSIKDLFSRGGVELPGTRLPVKLPGFSIR